MTTPNEPPDIPKGPSEEPENVKPPDYVEVLRSHIRGKGEEEQAADTKTPESIQEYTFDEMERLYPNPGPRKPRLVEDDQNEIKEEGSDEEN